MSNVKIKTRTVGQNFGTCALVERGGETIYTTGVKPLGFTVAALDAAESWCVEHGHETIEMAVARRSAHARGRGATIDGLKSDGWSGQEIGWAIKTGSLVKVDEDRVAVRS